MAEIITHPKYDPVRLSHDLAVLKVETKKDRFGDITGKIDLLHSDDVNAACIPGCANQFDYQFSNGTGVRYVNIISIQKLVLLIYIIWIYQKYLFIILILGAGLQDGERMESVDSFKLSKIG